MSKLLEFLKNKKEDKIKAQEKEQEKKIPLEERNLIKELKKNNITDKNNMIIKNKNEYEKHISKNKSIKDFSKTRTVKKYERKKTREIELER